MGAKLMHSSKDRILGQKTLHHGTSKKNWENIRKEGLKASRGGAGGAGAAVGDSDYMDKSRGFVHLTGQKAKANFYKRINGGSERINNDPKIKELEKIKDKHRNPENRRNYIFSDNEEGIKARKKMQELENYHERKVLGNALNPFSRDGKRVKVKMSYDKWKNNFEIDPDEMGELTIGKGKQAERIGKHMAGKGKIDVGTDEIVGLHKASKRIGNTMKNMPNYIKNNKGRFGTGVAAGVAGASLLGSSMKSIKDNTQDK